MSRCQTLIRFKIAKGCKACCPAMVDSMNNLLTSALNGQCTQRCSNRSLLRARPPGVAAAARAACVSFWLGEQSTHSLCSRIFKNSRRDAHRWIARQGLLPPPRAEATVPGVENFCFNYDVEMGSGTATSGNIFMLARRSNSVRISSRALTRVLLHTGLTTTRASEATQ